MGLAMAALSCTPLAQAQWAPGLPGPAPVLGARPEVVVSTVAKDAGLGVLADVPVVTLDALDHAALLAADAQRGGKTLRIGVARPFQLTAAMGRWYDTPGGARVWAVDVRATGAYGLRVHLTDMNLPEGAYLVQHNPAQPSDAAGPYTARGAQDLGEQYTATVWADTVRLELFVPAGVQLAELPFATGNVQHMYRDLPARLAQGQGVGQGAGEGGVLGTEGTCHNDVTCFGAGQPAATNFTNPARAVGLIFISGPGGTGSCTGQLISNQSADQAPLFLTASHCLSTAAEASSTEVYWLYQTSVCNGAVPSLNSLNRTLTSQIVATRGQSDGTLLRLTGLLPGGLFYQGWTASVPAFNTAISCIHHPDGAYKRISFGNLVNQTIYCAAGAGQLAGESYRVQWTSAVTEPGSSGSGLLVNDASNNKLLVGVLSCGNSACGVSSANLNDIYGRFSSFYPSISTFMTGGWPDDAQEPNDTCAGARVLSAPVSLTGLVVKLSDTDWYRVSVPAGQTLTATSTFTATSGNIDTVLLDACGGATLATGSVTGTGEQIVWTNTTGAARDVFINAFLNGTTPLNTYGLSLSLGTPPVVAANACTGAPNVGAGTYSGTTVGATTDGAASCISTQRPDVWYGFVAPAGGLLAVNTCTSTTDTVVSLHTACGAAAVACNDDANTGQGPCGSASNTTSYVTRTMNAGERVLIRVAMWGATPAAFNLNIAFTPVAPPANDLCAGAIPAVIGANPFDTSNAGTDGPLETTCTLGTAHNGIDKDVWFTYAPVTNGTLLAETCGTTWDTKLAIYSSCPSAADTTLLCDDDAVPACTSGSNLGSRLSLPVTGGTTYRIRVGGYRNAAGTVAFGTGVLTLGFTPSGPTACGPSDIASPGQNIGADGELTADDIIVFINWFFASDSRADIAGPGQTVGADAEFTADDIILFINRFFAGC